jgi:hypothetical protein
MNDKDKKAFEEWFLGLDNAHITSAMKLNRGWFEAWQAACEYKQKEIDFLKDRNETNISKVTCINQVNDGLHILLKEAEAELFEWKEAARSEADEVNRLQAENKKLYQELEIAKSIFREEGFDGAADDIEEALKFLGKNNNDK